MKNYLKMISACLVFTSFISLTACKDDTTTVGSNKQQGPEKITLTLWDNSASDQDARVIKTLVEKWNTENPGITIERDALDTESYKMKLKTAIAANEAPDIFASWGSGFSKPFIEAGKVYPLDSYLSEDIKKKLIPNFITNMQYDNKLYGLPWNMWYAVLYCNREMFDKYNLEYPKTFDDLINVVRAYRKNGVGPIAACLSEKWSASMYQNILALRTAGADNCNNALHNNGSFDTPEIAESAKLLQQLVKEKAFIDGYDGLNFDEAKALFKEGGIPMMMQGTWLSGELEMDECKVKGKIDAIKFPMVKGGKGTEAEYLGGSVDCYMISNNTKHLKEAVKALEYICREYSLEGFRAGMGLPVYNEPVDRKGIDRLTLQNYDMVKDAKKFVLAWDTVLVGKASQDHLDFVQGLFSGSITPENFAKKMQGIKQSSNQNENEGQ